MLGPSQAAMTPPRAFAHIRNRQTRPTSGGFCSLSAVWFHTVFYPMPGARRNEHFVKTPDNEAKVLPALNKLAKVIRRCYEHYCKI
jgi:hypothetical protein